MEIYFYISPLMIWVWLAGAIIMSWRYYENYKFYKDDEERHSKYRPGNYKPFIDKTYHVMFIFSVIMWPFALILALYMLIKDGIWIY